MDEIHLTSDWISITEKDDDCSVYNADKFSKEILRNDSIYSNNRVNIEYAHCTVGRPFCLAACYGSHKVLKALLDIGVDVLQQDFDGNNILHCIITASCLSNSEEKSFGETVIFLGKGSLRCCLKRYFFRIMII